MKVVLELPCIPYNCYECPVSSVYENGIYCNLKEHDYDHKLYANKRHPECPLKRVNERDKLKHK